MVAAATTTVTAPTATATVVAAAAGEPAAVVTAVVAPAGEPAARMAMMVLPWRGRHGLTSLRIDDPLVVQIEVRPPDPAAGAVAQQADDRDRRADDQEPGQSAHGNLLAARPGLSRSAAARSAYAGDAGGTRARGPAPGRARYRSHVRPDQPDVLVTGAGVIGLSVAAALLDAGLAVTVYAAQPPGRTTSAVAGALWGPHLVGADGRVDRWAGLTLARFRELASVPDAGVAILPGLAASAAAGSEESGPPPFSEGAGERLRCEPGQLPAGYTAGWRYSAPVIDMPAYLEFLLNLVRAGGGRLELGPPLRDLAGALTRAPGPVLVNCAGIGARELVPDPELEAVRGQVIVAANPGLAEFFVGDDADGEVTYIFPHGATVVLGGTHQHGSAILRADPADARRILDRCAVAEPRLAGAQVLAHRVGLRPVRPAVRLDAVPAASGRHVVHCYGHGGAGVTLSWGCALDVARLVSGLA